MGESPHSVLGLSQGCSKEDIKAAYHRQAKRWHPDLNKTEYAAERFRQVQLAANQLLESQDGRLERTARAARASWTPSAAHMRDSGFNRLCARGGVPLTLAACAAAICGGFVMFGIKWRQHEEMYPRRPRSLPGPRVAGVAEARELETSRALP